MNYTAISYETSANSNSSFIVKLKRNDGRIFYVDVWVDEKYNDVDCDWNQYIFYLTDAEDVARKKIQEDNDEFDDATSTAICFLEAENVIRQHDDASWYVVNNVKEI